MTSLKLRPQGENTIVILKGQSSFIYCPNCRDYTLHRKNIMNHEIIIYQCHICGNRVKFQKVLKKDPAKQ